MMRMLCRQNMVSRRKLRATGVLVLVAGLVSGVAAAQAGPPFRTDDPETPGNRHWEINFGWIGDRGAGAGNYQVPDVDVNYGWGDRIQLKYELPIAIHEDRPAAATEALPGPTGGPGTAATPGHVVGGLGESLLGVKWRFYEHRPAQAGKQGEAPEANFSVSTYPQLSLDNPTRSVPRGVVTPGPQFLLPIEINARIGPVRVDGEAGYWFTNSQVPQSWIRGLVVGHEFSERLELYGEIYDQQDANRTGTLPGVGEVDARPAKGRELTLGAGGRRALNRERSVVALFMAGRAIQAMRTWTPSRSGSHTLGCSCS